MNMENQSPCVSMVVPLEDESHESLSSLSMGPSSIPSADLPLPSRAAAEEHGIPFLPPHSLALMPYAPAADHGPPRPLVTTLPDPLALCHSVKAFQNIVDRANARLDMVGRFSVTARGRFLYTGETARELPQWDAHREAWGLPTNMAQLTIEVRMVEEISWLSVTEVLSLPASLSRLREMEKWHFKPWICLPPRDDALGNQELACEWYFPNTMNTSWNTRNTVNTLEADLSLGFMREAEPVAVPEQKPKPDYPIQDKPSPPCLPKEMLLLVFSKLPVRDVFRSIRRLSKEWYRVIWCREFRGLQSLYAPEENLLLEFSFNHVVGEFPGGGTPGIINSAREGLASVFHPACNGDPASWRSLGFVLPRSVRMVAFSRGLVCMMALPSSKVTLPEVYMCDPLSGTGSWIRSPHDVAAQQRLSQIFHVVGLVTKPNSPDYRILGIHSHQGPAQMYSSRTGVWTITQESVPPTAAPGPDPGKTVIDRFIHWSQRFGRGTAYKGRMYVLEWLQEAGRNRICVPPPLHLGLFSTDLASEEPWWVRQALALPRSVLLTCPNMVMDCFGRLLLLTTLWRLIPIPGQAREDFAACIWSLDTESMALEEVAKLPGALVDKEWKLRPPGFVPVSWFAGVDDLLYITIEHLQMQLVCSLLGPEVKWWWMPISAPILLCRGLDELGDYEAMPLTPRLDAFIPGPDVEGVGDVEE